MEQLLQILLLLVSIYLLIGLIFSIFFYRKGMAKIDEIAADSSFGFRLIVFPGVVVFWPFLLSKWIKQT